MCVDASSIAHRHRERRIKRMLKVLFGVVHYIRSEGVDREESDGIRNWATVIEEAFSLYLGLKSCPQLAVTGSASGPVNMHIFIRCIG